MYAVLIQVDGLDRYAEIGTGDFEQQRALYHATVRAEQGQVEPRRVLLINILDASDDRPGV